MSFLPEQTEEIKKLFVWARGTPIVGYDPAIWRYDWFGTLMRYRDYGDRSSEYGWEIDHAVPAALGGPDDWSNLRPLNWRNNAVGGGLLGGLLG
jgi:hypothetical protein